MRERERERERSTSERDRESGRREMNGEIESKKIDRGRVQRKTETT